MKETVRKYLKKLDGIGYEEWLVLSTIMNLNYESYIKDDLMFDYQELEKDEMFKKFMSN